MQLAEIQSNVIVTQIKGFGIHGFILLYLIAFNGPAVHVPFAASWRLMLASGSSLLVGEDATVSASKTWARLSAYHTGAPADPLPSMRARSTQMGILEIMW